MSFFAAKEILEAFLVVKSILFAATKSEGASTFLLLPKTPGKEELASSWNFLFLFDVLFSF